MVFDAEGDKLRNKRIEDYITVSVVIDMLAETATKDISQKEQLEGFEESRQVAKRGGRVAHIARKALEAETGEPVITSQNAVQLNAVATQMIETAVLFHGLYRLANTSICFCSSPTIS